MTLKKNNPQSGTTGRYVKKEEAEADLEGTFVTETTISRKKHKEATALFKKVAKATGGLENAMYKRGVYDTLNWLLNNAEKPNVE